MSYHFLTPQQFAHAVAAGDFVEHAEYSARRYGTLRSELDKRTASGHPVVLEIELQGARQVAAALPDAIRIFIAPPSLEALRTRLIGRGTDPPEQIERRLAVAEQELAAASEFSHVVVNDDLDRAIDELEACVRATLDG